jgi:hypothetical protein
MSGQNGATLPAYLAKDLSFLSGLVEFKGAGLGVIGSLQVFVWIAFSYILVMFFPNSNQLMKYGSEIKALSKKQPKRGKLAWRSDLPWLLFILALAGVSLLKLHDTSEFLYFNF